MRSPGIPTMFARALTLRCPNCGGPGLLRSWFKLQTHCPHCGLALERGERHDYWLGAYMFNLVASELIFAALLAGIIIWRWPSVPWDFLQYGGVALMAAAPLICFPFSRLVWLAFDI